MTMKEAVAEAIYAKSVWPTFTRADANELAFAALKAAAANVGDAEEEAVGRYAGDDYKGMVAAALNKAAEG